MEIMETNNEAMDYDVIQNECTQTSLPTKQRQQRQKQTKVKDEDKTLLEDKYTPDILRERYYNFTDSYRRLHELITTTKLPIRHQNPPEDMTENIAKFIIRNYDNDPSCKWAKGIGLKGDLYSNKYSMDSPPEVKAFTSDGPSQFGPKKKFSVLYFLDLRNWISDKIILWRVNLTNESPEMKGIKMNKTQTHEEQCSEGRRPHISWDKLYPQISEHCIKIYEGTFENIFIPIHN
jgi:hypothetical protein